MNKVMIQKKGLGIMLMLFACLIITQCKKSKDMVYGMYNRQVEPAGELDDEKVKKFIRTCKILRESGINYFSMLSQNRDGVKGQADLFNKIEADIKKGGFASYAEFVRVTARVAWAWNIAQAEIGMKRQEKLQAWGQDEFEKGKNRIAEMLADPNLPGETKNELRKTLQEINDSQVKVTNDYAKNKKWADLTMKLVRPLARNRDVEAVMRHESEIMQVFTGLSAGQLRDIEKNTFRELDDTSVK